jgi:predicted Zn-dependent peptidase
MKIIDEINFGNYHKTVFENGLTIVSEFVSEIRSFAAGVCVNAGSKDDYSEKEGIAHFMEHSAFRRTKNRTSKQIANEFEALGAYSNAFTTKELTCFYVRALQKHFAKTFELLADITLNTIFVENEIEKEKLIIVEEIKSYEDDPEEYVCDLADTLVFAGNSFASPILGNQNSVGNINCSDLENFHKEFYQPSNITISVAGNIQHSEIIKLANEYFTQKSSTKKLNNFVIQENKSKKLIVQKEIQQSHIVMGLTTKGIKSDERYPLSVMNVIFGDGMSSRLYQNLREKYGLAYSIYSSIQNYATCGGFYIYAATDENNNEKAINLIFEEMNKFINVKKPTKKELHRAKEQLKTATIIELESMSSRMQNLLKQEICAGKFENSDKIIDNIEQINLDDIMKVSEKYFSTKEWNICQLLPK